MINLNCQSSFIFSQAVKLNPDCDTLLTGISKILCAKSSALISSVVPSLILIASAISVK